MRKEKESDNIHTKTRTKRNSAIASQRIRKHAGNKDIERKEKSERVREWTREYLFLSLSLSLRVKERERGTLV